MDQDNFVKLVGRYQKTLERSPLFYKSGLLCFIGVGFFAYGLLMVLALGSLGLTLLILFLHPSVLLIKLGIKFALPLFAVIWAMFASLRIAPYVPRGIEIRRPDSPWLFARLDDICRKLDVPHLGKVVLNHECNAAVVHHARFGFFRAKATLMLGLPLMSVLSKAEFESVLAHEMGHLSRNHSRFNGWVYQVVAMFDNLDGRMGSSAIVRTFLNWYSPRLSARSFPLRRQNEYEADAAAAELCGAKVAASALMRLSTREKELSKFWKSVYRSSLETPHPPVDAFLRLDESLKASEVVDTEESSKSLAEALMESPDASDTHPTLKQRLAALGVSPELSASEEPNAASVVFEDRLTTMATNLGYDWSAIVALEWEESFRKASRRRQRLTALESTRATRMLSADEAFEYADIAEDLVSSQDPIILYRAVLELYPDHVPTRFSVGRLLVERGDEEGYQILTVLSQTTDRDLRAACSYLIEKHRKAQEAV